MNDTNSQTALDMEQYGLTVIIVKRTGYLPSFAYSIGLWQKFGHPELICFGLDERMLHGIINEAAAIVKEGNKIVTEVSYNEILKNFPVWFIAVDQRNIGDYFGRAIDHYRSAEFPALQLVWPDNTGKFPWEEEFDKNIFRNQPLLDRNAGFKFAEPRNLGVITTRQWLEQKKPILQVTHDEDGDWQFLTGDQQGPEDGRLVALEQLTLADPTLNEVFGLDYGESATRNAIGGAWIKAKLEEES